jgi:hypothetical protein
MLAVTPGIAVSLEFSHNLFAFLVHAVVELALLVLERNV